MANHDFQYDFVISYAGEDTVFAEDLKSKLEEKGAKVFYAPDNQAQTWGENLYEFLAELYSKKGLFCIPIISKDYVRKQWTKHEWKSAQERALRESDTTYILPIRLDASELPGLFDQTAYLHIDSHTIEEIVNIAIEKLSLFAQDISIENVRQPQPDKVWEYKPQPNQRSAFLRENNYLNRKDNDFAINEWTSRLYVRSDEKFAEHFISAYVIPIPSAIFIDKEDIIEKLGLEEQIKVIRFQTPATEGWQTFNLNRYHHSRTGQTDYVMYHYPEWISEVRAISFIRFDEDGSLEFAMSRGGVERYSKEDKWSYSYITTLGIVLKLVTLAKIYYSRIGYEGKYQIGINLVNTYNTILCDFAMKQNSLATWESRCSNNFTRIEFVEQNQGITLEQNLQFVYDINPLVSTDWKKNLEEMIVHLGRRLQRSYNYKPIDERHLLPQSNEFPWWQFKMRNDI